MSEERRGYDRAIRDVVKALRAQERNMVGYVNVEWSAKFIESRFGSSPETSPDAPSGGADELGPGIWGCQIGEVDRARLPEGSDAPMRRAVRDAYTALTGEEPEFIFSGWGSELSEIRRAVVEDRLPVEESQGADRAPRDRVARAIHDADGADVGDPYDSRYDKLWDELGEHWHRFYLGLADAALAAIEAHEKENR